MPRSVTVVINAAGLGSRLDYGLPKCLVPVLGRPLIEWQLDLLSDVEVIVVAGYRAAEVSKAVSEIRSDIPIVINHRFHDSGTALSLRLGARIAQNWVVSLDGDLLPEPCYLDQFITGPGSMVGASRRATAEAVGLNIDADHSATEMGYEITGPLEWNGLLRLRREQVVTFGEGHVFESLRPFLPLPVVLGSCVEIDDSDDLRRANKWMKSRVSGGSKNWTR